MPKIFFVVILIIITGTGIGAYWYLSKNNSQPQAVIIQNIPQEEINNKEEIKKEDINQEVKDNQEEENIKDKEVNKELEENKDEKLDKEESGIFYNIFFIIVFITSIPEIAATAKITGGACEKQCNVFTVIFCILSWLLSIVLTFVSYRNETKLSLFFTLLGKVAHMIMIAGCFLDYLAKLPDKNQAQVVPPTGEAIPITQ